MLALAGLKLGVPRALAIDTDDEAVRVAIENARINGVSDRLDVRRGGPASIAGTWPLVVANILAAVLIEFAPSLTRHVAHQGRLVLSGIPASVEGDVLRTYCRLGMRHVSTTSRGDWVALQLETTW